MSKLIKIVGSIVIVLVAALLLMSVTGFEPGNCPPTDRSFSCKVPGLWLKGERVTTPVTDWSFTDQIPQIKIQTQTPFLLPHSVTIWCAVYNGNLYISSNPGKLWNDDILRNPHVRLKIGDQLFDRTLTVVDDPAVKEGVLLAKEKKYSPWKAPPVSKATVFLVAPQ
jgi:hypothetical protein